MSKTSDNYSRKTQPCSVNLWKKRFDTEIDNRYWKAAFNANQETRLKVLQWKILHNIHPTSILLHKMGIANSETCNACHSGEMDYIEHFFFTCAKKNKKKQQPYLATSEKGNTSTHRQYHNHLSRRGATWPPRASMSDAKHPHNQLPDNTSQNVHQQIALWQNHPNRANL